MPKEITKTISEEKSIIVSEFDPKRCSRNCYYCKKSFGLYHCYLNDYEGEEIEKLDDVYDDKFDTADTYGFLRTDYCLKHFGMPNKQDAISKQ